MFKVHLFEEYGSFLQGNKLDISVVQSALPELESRLRDAAAAKTQIAEENHGASHTVGGSIYEDPRAAIEAILGEMYQILLIVFEAAQLPDAQGRLEAKWNQLSSEGGIGHSSWNSRFEFLEHPAFECISSAVDGLRTITGDPMASRDAIELAHLEQLLHRTAELVHGRRITPTKEADIAAVMRDYLRAWFPQYVDNLMIPGFIKNFKPDGGVLNLKAAFEFKYAVTAEEVRQGFDGILADGGGYKGSLDWIRFYSVIYQTKPFISQVHLDQENKRTGMVSWKPILVTGVGRRGKAVKSAKSKH